MVFEAVTGSSSRRKSSISNERRYEIWIIKTSEGARLRYYFDVTSFHG